jgi:hypothetical protein
MISTLSQGRGWTATGAFTSRCGPGEGSIHAQVKRDRAKEGPSDRRRNWVLRLRTGT